MGLRNILKRLSHETAAVAALEALGDIVLLAEVRAMGENFDESPGEYVAGAARRFAATATDEEWLGLMTVIGRAEDPAAACLVHMVRSCLKHDAAAIEANDDEAALAPKGACGCGGRGACHGH